MAADHAGAKPFKIWNYISPMESTGKRNVTKPRKHNDRDCRASEYLLEIEQIFTFAIPLHAVNSIVALTSYSLIWRKQNDEITYQINYCTKFF